MQAPCFLGNAFQYIFVPLVFICIYISVSPLSYTFQFHSVSSNVNCVSHSPGLVSPSAGILYFYFALLCVCVAMTFNLVPFFPSFPSSQSPVLNSISYLSLPLHSSHFVFPYFYYMLFILFSLWLVYLFKLSCYHYHFEILTRSCRCFNIIWYPTENSDYILSFIQWLQLHTFFFTICQLISFLKDIDSVYKRFSL